MPADCGIFRTRNLFWDPKISYRTHGILSRVHDILCRVHEMMS